MIDVLKRDYARMAGIIMGTVPEFGEIIAGIQNFEHLAKAVFFNRLGEVRGSDQLTRLSTH